VKSLYADFYTDLRVSASTGKTITVLPEQLQKLRSLNAIQGFSFVMEEKALLQNEDFRAIVLLKGVDTSYKNVAGVSRKLVKGKFELGTEEKPAAVMGAGIENAVSVQSDRSLFPLTIYLPKRDLNIEVADPLQSLSANNIYTSGSFVIQQDFDNKYVITNLDFVKHMLGLQPNEFGAIEIRLRDEKEDERVKEQLASIFGKEYLIQTRYEQNRSLYSVMQVEKWVIYALLSLILIVAAFTMIGALTMLVLEKRKDIQLLKALGTNNSLVQKIFLSEGILLATVGGGLGVMLAFLICWLQVHYKLVKLEGSSFLIDYYPVKMVPADLLLVLLTVFIVSWTASWFPSRKASREPIELRS
jgi:lipoprotein-releasing system permease protein